MNHPNINCVRVQSAEEMFQAATGVFDSCDAAIMAAAVADYTPKTVSDIKIKKKDCKVLSRLLAVVSPIAILSLGRRFEIFFTIVIIISISSIVLPKGLV